MYFEAVKVFCDVVRFGSFSRAGAANAITQSAVSQNVSKLEKTLGVRLIDRSKRPFELTPEGRVYYDGCRGLVEQYHGVESRVRALADAVAGSVRVAAIYSVGLKAMSQYVRRFAQHYPQASVRLAYLHPEQVYESVIHGEADVGLLSYPKARRKVTVRPWRDQPMVLVAWPGHSLANQSAVCAADLVGERFVAFDESLAIREAIDRELTRAGVEVDVVMTFDNVEAIKCAVEMGEGIAILPEPTVAGEVRAAALAAMTLADLELTRPLGFICRKDIEPGRAARAFIELVTGQSGPQAANAREPSGNGGGDVEEDNTCRQIRSAAGVGAGV